MENYAMTNFEEMVADEMFPETNNAYDSENFPTKDRSRSSARRKKTYFKGKKRYTDIYHRGYAPLINEPDKEHVIRGMLRKTKIIKFHDRDDTIFHTTRSNVRRQLIANDKMMEFAMEA